MRAHLLATLPAVLLLAGVAACTETPEEEPGVKRVMIQNVHEELPIHVHIGTQDWVVPAGTLTDPFVIPNGPQPIRVDCASAPETIELGSDNVSGLWELQVDAVTNPQTGAYEYVWGFTIVE